MNERARTYWKILNELEDYVRFGERSARPDPGNIVFKSSRSAPGQPGSSRSVEGGSAVGATRDGRRDTLTPERRARRMAEIAEKVSECRRCQLHEKRLNAVPGIGVLDPDVMVIGEGPGAEEDRRGIPFVGRAGQYLDKWLEAIDVSRDTNAFIGNIVKCRPPGNRDPQPIESDTCIPYLKEQIELVRPKTILSVGRIASGILVGTNAGIGSLRGRTYYYDGIPLIPTYHPAAVLRNPDLRRPVWEDLKRLAALIADGGPASGGHEPL